jgi:biotin carboxyl carrier protein
MTPAQKPARHTITLNDTVYETTFTKKFAQRKPHVPKDSKRLTAIIPGLILEVCVQPGEAVRRGQTLLILEAMKMQNHLTATTDGTVQALHTASGETVTKGQLLVAFE